MKNITSILIERGEGLLDDDGVDAAVAETIAFEIMHSLAVQPQCVYAVTSDFYWGRGADLEGAIASCYKSGSRGSQDAVIYIYTGPQAEPVEISERRLCAEALEWLGKADGVVGLGQ